MISATVMTAQTAINIINGDISHLGSGKPGPRPNRFAAIAHRERGPSPGHYKRASTDRCKFLQDGHDCTTEPIRLAGADGCNSRESQASNPTNSTFWPYPNGCGFGANWSPAVCYNHARLFRRKGMATTTTTPSTTTPSVEVK